MLLLITHVEKLRSAKSKHLPKILWPYKAKPKQKPRSVAFDLYTKHLPWRRIGLKVEA